MAFATVSQRTVYSLFDATWAGPVADGRVGVAHGGGVLRTVNELLAEESEGQTLKSTSTRQRIVPLGTATVNW